MLELLHQIEVDTLEQIVEDLGPMDFTNAELIRTVSRILESKRSHVFEEGDTLSMEVDCE